MKTKHFAIIGGMLAGWFMSGQAVLAGTLQIVHSIEFASRFENPRSADLAWDGDHLWTSMWSTLPPLALQDFSMVEIDPSDGSILSSTPHARTWDGQPVLLFGYTWDGSHLWITNPAYGIDSFGDPLADHVYRSTTDGTPLGEIEVPHSPNGSPRGAAWDGAYLWLSDSAYATISQIDPVDGSLMASFASPGAEPRGVAWGSASLWIADAADNVIYQVDAAGNLIDTWSAPGVHPDGITFDGEYLWVSDNEARKIFQLAIPEPSSLALLALAGSGLVFLALRGRKRGLTNGVDHGAW